MIMTKELILHKTGILKLVSAKKQIFNEKPSKIARDIPTSWEFALNRNS